MVYEEEEEEDAQVGLLMKHCAAVLVELVLWVELVLRVELVLWVELVW